MDQQIEEKRIARERERLKNLELDAMPPRGGGEEIDASSSQSEVRSTGYGRGRGLADLMGRQASDSATKRQQQQELKVSCFSSFGKSSRSALYCLDDTIIRLGLKLRKKHILIM